jgi:hypothetical protein
VKQRDHVIMAGSAPDAVHDAFPFLVMFMVHSGARGVALPCAVHAVGHCLHDESRLITAAEEGYVGTATVRKAEALVCL